MATAHTLLFSMLGAAMWFAPAIAPAYFPAGRLDGSNTSALWLQFMGLVNGSIGVSYLLHLEAVPSFERLLTWSIQWSDHAIAAGILRPIPSLEALMQLREEREWRTII